MAVNKTLLALALTVAVLAGCKKKEAEVPADAAPAAMDASAPNETSAAPATDASRTTDTSATTAEPAQPQAQAVKAFDITSIAVSDKPLGEWPYLVPPAGYEFHNATELAKRTKDLARVPIWTGSQLLWVEGKAFSNRINPSEGKNFSKFELGKGLQQAVEALGGVRINEAPITEELEKANEKALDEFRTEFGEIDDAYSPYKQGDTYVIRLADKAVWVVTYLDPVNERGHVMVAEGPLPEPDKK